jgi:hypothetical protein
VRAAAMVGAGAAACLRSGLCAACRPGWRAQRPPGSLRAAPQRVRPPTNTTAPARPAARSTISRIRGCIGAYSGRQWAATLRWPLGAQKRASRVRLALMWTEDRSNGVSN